MTPNLAFKYLILVASFSLAQKPSISKTFDSSEWIPMRQPCKTCHEQQQQHQPHTKRSHPNDQQPHILNDQIPQKTGRVLNTAVPFQRNYFPVPQNFRENIFASPNQPVIIEKQKLTNNVPTLPVTFPNQILTTSNNPNIYQIAPQNGPGIPLQRHQQQSPEHLTPQFLPRLEEASFNPPPPLPQRFVPQGQQAFFHNPQQPRFIQTQPQLYTQQSNLAQPQDDFHLLQQILNNPNSHFVESLLNLNQTPASITTQQEIKQESQPTTTPRPVTTENVVKTIHSEKPTILTPTLTSLPQNPEVKEEVQLLYVPLETLQRQRESVRTKPDVATEKVFDTTFNPFYYTDNRKQAQLQTIQRDFAQQALQAQQLQHQLQQRQHQLQQNNIKPVESVSATSTKKKQKLKPHQPPLAVFMNANGQELVKVTDVLDVLSRARTISVLDQVSPKMPQVFVGPSNLKTPIGYAKFDLPYLSNIDGNRIQRKVEQLPFFVAPLSYTAPEGYSKIPFPSPHVGSVIIKDMKSYEFQPDDSLNILNDNFNEKFKYNPNLPLNQFISNLEQQIPPNNLINTNKFAAQNLTPTPASIETQTEAEISTKPDLPLSPAPVTPSQNPLTQYYFTNPTPTRRINTNRGTPLSIYQPTPRPTAQSRTTPNSFPDYTVLEQFPIRQETTTENKIDNRDKIPQTTINPYAQYNLDQFRDHPVEINDEIQTQNRYQKETIPQYVNDDDLPSRVIPSIENTRKSHRLPSSTTAPQAHNSPQSNTEQYLIPSPIEQPAVVSKQITSSQDEQQTPKTVTQIFDQQNGHQQQEYFQPSPVIPPVTIDSQYEQIYNQQFAQIRDHYRNQRPNVLNQQFSTNYQPVQSTTENIPLKEQNIETQEQNVPEQPSITTPVDLPTNGELSPTITQARHQPTYNTEQSTQVKQQQYSLPPQLPPINPSLPGLINSLQDEQKTETSPESITQQTTTRRPTSVARRPASRGRTRHPSRLSTTTTEITPYQPRSRVPQHRQRRPYNSRTRTEKYSTSSDKNQNYPDNVSSTTTLSTVDTKTSPEPTIAITTLRPGNRYVYQQEQALDSSRGNNNNGAYATTRSRFRTRGRQRQSTTTPQPSPAPTPGATIVYPVNSQSPLTDRNSITYHNPSTEPTQIFQQPKLESGFQVSPTFTAQREQQSITEQQQNQQYFSEQRPVNQQYFPEQRPVYQHTQQTLLQQPAYNDPQLIQNSNLPQEGSHTQQNLRQQPAYNNPQLLQNSNLPQEGSHTQQSLRQQPAYNNPQLIQNSNLPQEGSHTQQSLRQQPTYNNPQLIQNSNLPQDGSPNPIYVQQNLQSSNVEQETSPRQKVHYVQENLQNNIINVQQQNEQSEILNPTASDEASTEQTSEAVPTTTEKKIQQYLIEVTTPYRQIKHQNSQSYHSNDESKVISQPTGNEGDYVRINGGTQQNSVLHFPTTESTFTRRPLHSSRTRTRTRTRGRVYPSTTTTTTEAITTTTTVATTEKLQEQSEEQSNEPEEFYGFLRNPIYQPPQPNYQYHAISSTPKYISSTLVPNVDRSQYFSPTERASTVNADTIYVNNSTHSSLTPVIAYLSHINEASQTSAETENSKSEEYVAPSPVYTIQSSSAQPLSEEEITTRRNHKNQYFVNRPAPNRFSRPTNLAYTTTVRTINTNDGGRYTVRPPKRPDGETKVTKVRGRIRKPTKPTTTTTTTEEAQIYPQEQYIQTLPQTVVKEQPIYSEQYLIQDAPNQRKYPNRGRSHFKLPHTLAAQQSDDDDGSIEGENYPVSFLNAQEAYTQQPPQFKITVAPVEAEYSDQVPYQSVRRTKFVARNPEDGTAESQWNHKYTSTSFRKNNTNEIIINDKQPKDIIREETTENQSLDMINKTNSQNTEDKSIFEQIFEEMAKFGMDETTTSTSTTSEEPAISTTTIKSTTNESDKKTENIGEIKVTKGKRRGYWKRVRVRPVDSLEASESQNIGFASSSNLISDSAKKVYPRPTLEQYIITFESNDTNPGETEQTSEQVDKSEIVTILPEITTNYDLVTENSQNIPNENESSSGPGFFESLFNFFGDNDSNSTSTFDNDEKISTTKESISEIESETTTDGIMIAESTTDPVQQKQIETESTTISAATTSQQLDISYNNQLNETKIIKNEIKSYTEQLENLQDSKLDKSKQKLTDQLILRTSTSTEISHETEICYRGRCVKSSNTTDINEKS